MAIVQEGGDVRRHLAGVHHAALLLIARDAGLEAACTHRKQLIIHHGLRVLPLQNALAVLSPPEGEEAQVVKGSEHGHIKRPNLLATRVVVAKVMVRVRITGACPRSERVSVKF